MKRRGLGIGGFGFGTLIGALIVGVPLAAAGPWPWWVPVAQAGLGVVCLVVGFVLYDRDRRFS